MNIEKIMIITLIIVLVVMGPSQLPKLAKTFGKGVKSLRDGMEGVDDEEGASKPKKKPVTESEEDEADEAPKPKKKAKADSDEDE